MAGFAFDTQVNSDGSVAAGSRPAVGEAGGVVPTTAYTVYDGDDNEIGFITGLDDSEARPAERIRHLNAFDAGETIEQVPRPSEVTLTARGFTIYKKGLGTTPGGVALAGGDSLIGRLASTVSPARLFKTLEDQRISFDIRVTEAKFDVDSGDPIEVQGKIYRECWFTNHTKPRDIGQANSAETASIQVGFVENDPEFS